MAVSLVAAWTPKSVPVIVLAGGDQFPYNTQNDNVVRPSDSRYIAYTTPTNTPITFTATFVSDDSQAVEYRWDFGNGDVGYGQSVTYTFRVPAEQLAVALTVTDSKRRVKTVNQQLNLRQANPFNASLGLNV